MAWKTVLTVLWMWARASLSVGWYQNQDGPVVPSQRNANRYPDKQSPLPAQTSDDNDQVWPGVAAANQQATRGAQGASKADKKRRKQAGRNANRSKKWNNRPAEIKAQFPELTDNQAGTIANHGVFVGMTRSHVTGIVARFSGARWNPITSTAQSMKVACINKPSTRCYPRQSTFTSKMAS